MAMAMAMPGLEGPLFAALGSRFDFDRREFEKTPTPSPEKEKEEEGGEASRVEIDLDVNGGELDLVSESSAPMVEVAPVVDRSPDPPRKVDIFDLFDILAKVGIVEEEEDEDDLASKAAAAAKAAEEKEKKKKRRPPFGCRELNVVQCRHYVDFTEEELSGLNPLLRQALLDNKARALADQAERERARLEYLDSVDAS